ncbi:hypothetical protein B0H16DRAFT_955512 [Mycena metata]|uniref:Secreted protein n=1 Tax=Mycena metata TaxID=1033252 RepID=A0AAD7NW07_9AGAR|nr:hypothetical protein B0H16DRAFT_955512 [Mycena metata]
MNEMDTRLVLVLLSSVVALSPELHGRWNTTRDNHHYRRKKRYHAGASKRPFCGPIPRRDERNNDRQLKLELLTAAISSRSPCSRENG